jgi:hypothetical protein
MSNAPLDAPALSDALDAKLLAGDRDGALQLARAALPSWAARVAVAGLDAEPDDVLDALDEAASSVRAEALRGRSALRMLASVSSALGMIGAIVHLGGAFRDPLLALAPALAQRIALGHALSCVALGLGTATVAFLARAAVIRQGDRWLAGADTVALRLPIALGALPAAEPRNPGGVTPSEA